MAPPGDRRAAPARLATFAAADAAAADDGVTSVTYSSIGLEPGVDLLLWRTAPSVDALEAGASALLRTGIGSLADRHATRFLGRIGPSQYVAQADRAGAGLTGPANGRATSIVYPFTKSTELVPPPARRRARA